MRTAADRFSAKASGGAAHARRTGRAASSTASASGRGAAMLRVRPPSDLLALQRLIAGTPPAPVTPELADDAQVHEAAQYGTRGPSGPLPYFDVIQRSFGEHDVSGVAAHADQAAAEGSRAL